jgi:hypothetical protein
VGGRAVERADGQPHSQSRTRSCFHTSCRRCWQAARQLGMQRQPGRACLFLGCHRHHLSLSLSLSLSIRSYCTPPPSLLRCACVGLFLGKLLLLLGHHAPPPPPPPLASPLCPLWEKLGASRLLLLLIFSLACLGLTSVAAAAAWESRAGPVGASRIRACGSLQPKGSPSGPT